MLLLQMDIDKNNRKLQVMANRRFGTKNDDQESRITVFDDLRTIFRI